MTQVYIHGLGQTPASWGPLLERLDALNRDLSDAQRELKILKGALFCDVCGAENAATNVYCQECGQPLSRL